MPYLSSTTSLTQSILVENTAWKIAFMWVPPFPHYFCSLPPDTQALRLLRPAFHSPEKTIHPNGRCLSQSNPQPLQKDAALTFPQPLTFNSVAFVSVRLKWGDKWPISMNTHRVVPIWSAYNLAKIAFNGRIIVSQCGGKGEWAIFTSPPETYNCRMHTWPARLETAILMCKWQVKTSSSVKL